MGTTSATEIASLRRSLERMGLEAPPGGFRLRPLVGGISSMIACAETRSGPVCIKRALPRLTVNADWHAPLERNRAEVAWIRCAGRIVPSAVPRLLGEDPAEYAFAMSYLPAATHPVWKTLLRDGVADPQTACEVGKRLVAIHAATADRSDLAQAFANDASFHALRVEPYFLTAARTHPDCCDALHQLAAGLTRVKRALMHGDVSPKNILVGPHGPIFLDAECACYGDPAFDLAFCLNHLLLKCLWRPRFRPLYFTCFDALAEAYLDGVRWEQVADFEMRSCRLLAGLLLARVDGKSPVEYLTDEAERTVVRTFARGLLRRPLARAREVREAWDEFITTARGLRPL